LSNTEGNRRVKIKLPCFEDGEDLEGFLWQFERAMKADEIPDEEWSIKLTCLLKGKARKVVTQMKHEDVDDYTRLKKELLKKFRLTSEEYIGKLKQVRKNHGESARELMGRIEQYTDRWVELSGKTQSYESLKELFMIDFSWTRYLRSKRCSSKKEDLQQSMRLQKQLRFMSCHASLGVISQPKSDQHLSVLSVLGQEKVHQGVSLLHTKLKQRERVKRLAAVIALKERDM
jgi:hypothetical protein